MLEPAWPFPRGFLLGINTCGGGGSVKLALVSEPESESDIGDSALGGVAGLLDIVSSETEGSFSASSLARFAACLSDVLLVSPSLTEDVANPSVSPLIPEPLAEIFCSRFPSCTNVSFRRLAFWFSSPSSSLPFLLVSLLLATFSTMLGVDFFLVLSLLFSLFLSKVLGDPFSRIDAKLVKLVLNNLLEEGCHVARSSV